MTSKVCAVAAANPSRPLAARTRLVPARPQAGRDELGGLDIVFDDQDPHGAVLNRAGGSRHRQRQFVAHGSRTVGSSVRCAAMRLPIERLLPRALIVIALAALIAGGVASANGDGSLARWLWAAGAIPVIFGLVASILRDLLAGRLGVDAVALLAMVGALALGESLAAIVIAVMYAGGNALEEFAVSRAERDLRSLIDRAPRIAHRERAGELADIPVAQVKAGDRLLVRAGEVLPVDGLLANSGAVLDKSALTGEPIPVLRRKGEAARSGAVNAGQTFALQATATEGESTYAGIVKMVTAAQTAKAPAIRTADRFALLLLPVALALAGTAWFFSSDPVRGLAVLVTATPCPLILAAPVAYIAGVARAARRGVLMKGGFALEALAKVRTVIFDKTGTLTVGGARLLRIEAASGWNEDDTLRIVASLEQASQHPVAAAIVAAARDRGLPLDTPLDVRETMGSGLEGAIDGRRVRAGAHAYVFGAASASPWGRRILQQASLRSALAVFVTIDGKPAGAILLADQLRREAPRAIQGLRAEGVSRIIMLTGDRAETAEAIASALDLDAVLSDRDPGDKVAAVAVEQELQPTLMVGDGVNDAPALAAARCRRSDGRPWRERFVGSGGRCHSRRFCGPRRRCGRRRTPHLRHRVPKHGWRHGAFRHRHDFRRFRRLDARRRRARAGGDRCGCDSQRAPCAGLGPRMAAEPSPAERRESLARRARGSGIEPRPAVRHHQRAR